MIYHMATYVDPRGKITSWRHDSRLTLGSRSRYVLMTVDAKNVAEAADKAIELRRIEERKAGNDI